MRSSHGISEVISGWMMCTMSPTLNHLEINMEYKTWVCAVCGYVYSEADGDEEHGLAPGTRWADVPDDWTCPECGAEKSDFEMEVV
jgi:rubredoxin